MKIDGRTNKTNEHLDHVRSKYIYTPHAYYMIFSFPLRRLVKLVVPIESPRQNSKAAKVVAAIVFVLNNTTNCLNLTE
uniref:Uncharacterized protein n=1 Tax=Amphimedon queenslandica TaxID=400682 RepID=A0A1X7VBI1_AMPQE